MSDTDQLLFDLGYRPPSRRELAHAGNSDKNAGESVSFLDRFTIPAVVLCRDPWITFSGLTPNAPLGLASILPPRFDEVHQEAYFLLSPTWSIGTPAAVSNIRRHTVALRSRFRGRKLIFACNTPDEVMLMREQGEAVIFYAKTCSVNENIFKPLDGIAAEFDAIYNAQLVAWKRHYLALGIENCAFLFYRGLVDDITNYEEQRIIFGHSRAAPKHCFINKFDENGEPIRLPPEEINRHLNRARTGLALSGEEGPMFSSVEYLLAGLPVVSTYNRGGRSVFLKDDASITVEDNASKVALAVADMIRRRIPKLEIRERTLERIRPFRSKFTSLINEIASQAGSSANFAEDDIYSRPDLLNWYIAREAVALCLDALPTGG